MSNSPSTTISLALSACILGLAACVMGQILLPHTHPATAICVVGSACFAFAIPPLWARWQS
jgi:ABC-type uncharacterized transport system permease subunit